MCKEHHQRIIVASSTSHLKLNNHVSESQPFGRQMSSQGIEEVKRAMNKAFQGWKLAVQNLTHMLEELAVVQKNYWEALVG